MDQRERQYSGSLPNQKSMCEFSFSINSDYPKYLTKPWDGFREKFNKFLIAHCKVVIYILELLTAKIR